MKKKLFILLLSIISVVCLAVGLSACGGNGTKNSEHEHSLVYYSAVDATETEDGNIEYWYCSSCGKYYSDATATKEISQSAMVIAATGHSLIYTEAVDATCTENGNTEYWYCSGCDKYFSDEVATTEISQSDTIVEATGHFLTRTEAVAATCTEDGNTEYWYCSSCGKYYSNEAATSEISKSTTKIAATGHNLTHTKVVASTCTEDGNIEYWYCADCGKYYSDAKCTTEISQSATVTVATGHTLIHKEAVAATCTEDGNTEYWYCSSCGKYYSDEYAITEISMETTAITATGHIYE